MALSSGEFMLVSSVGSLSLKPKTVRLRKQRTGCCPDVQSSDVV